MKAPRSTKTWEPNWPLALVLRRDGGVALARSLHAQLRQAILQGRLAAGTRLPATRTLASMLSVSRNTVLQAYDLLAGEGYVEARSGGGTRVAAQLRLPRAAATPAAPVPAAARAPALRPAVAAPPAAAALDFRVGRPDIRSFPADVWNRLHSRAVRALFRAGAAAPGRQGLAALREAIVAHGSTTRAVAATPDQVVVTQGAQHAFHTIGLWLRGQGVRTIAVENPGYAAARAAFASAGLQVVPVPVDADGMVVDAIPGSARAVCVTPSHQFPLGVCLSLERRLALLAWAQWRRAVIIEDDYDSEFRHSARPLDALHALAQGTRVLYVGTFSKSMFPELRAGYVIADPALAAALALQADVAGGGPAAATQAALAAFIAEGHLWRHTRAMQKRYTALRHALLQALQRHAAALGEPYVSHAGLHVATCMGSRAQEARAVAAAARLGMAVEPLSQRAFAPGAPAGLTFGLAAVEAAQVEPAIGRLARALAC